MSRKQFHVVPGGDKWKVEQGGNEFGHYDTKREAIERGRTVAQQNQPSQLVIHTGDGRIETEYTYKNDPFPPAG
jgi:hypothetical protein